MCITSNNNRDHIVRKFPIIIIYIPINLYSNINYCQMYKTYSIVHIHVNYTLGWGHTSVLLTDIKL